MAREIETAQRRADLNEIARQLVLQINEITPSQWDKHDDKDRAIVLAALLATRRDALRDAAKDMRKGATLYGNDGWRERKAVEEWANELDRLASEGE